MKKCCFVIPYFGKLPAAMPVFLKSCGANPDFDWLLLTDDGRPLPYPPNVHVKPFTMEAFRALAEEKLGFAPCIPDPHKLCDLKPAYGFLLEEELRDYRFWGYCDIDTVMGNLGHFLTEERLAAYDKLFCLGHMTLFRNTPENNRLFMSAHNGRALYREVFTRPETVWFDEEYQDDDNVNRIFLRQGRPVLQEDLSLNVWIGDRRFRRTVYVGPDGGGDGHGYRTEAYSPSCVFWDRGRLLRMTERDGALHTVEFLYIHLQYRDMAFGPEVLTADTFRIVPNRFAAVKRLPRTVFEFRMTPKSARLSGLARAFRRRLNRL